MSGRTLRLALNLRRYAGLALKFQVSPGFEQYADQAKDVLERYLRRYGKEERDFGAARYVYLLEKVKDYYGELTFVYKYFPIEKSKSSEEIAEPDDYRYEYYRSKGEEWDGKTGKRQYKTPKDAIEEITQDDRFAYRGMSWEEWRFIQTKGYIESKGVQNFNNQGGLTFFGPRSETGVVYSGSFAPAEYKATPTRPGVVIAIPKEGLLTHKDDPGVPAGELAYRGKLPKSHIAHAWMLVATAASSGYFELITSKYKPNKIGTGSASQVSIRYSIRQMF